MKIMDRMVYELCVNIVGKCSHHKQFDKFQFSEICFCQSPFYQFIAL
jgi:hypothetical protein